MLLSKKISIVETKISLGVAYVKDVVHHCFYTMEVHHLRKPFSIPFHPNWKKKAYLRRNQENTNKLVFRYGMDHLLANQ